MGNCLPVSSSEPLASSTRAEQVVVITGCDSGFGYQLAVHAACDLGFAVVAACFTSEGEERLRQELKDKGGVVVKADLTDDAGLQSLISAAEGAAEKYGGGIWAVVNNAGIVLPGNVEWNPPSAYEKTMAINFHVPVQLTYQLLPRIKKCKGRIINVTSVDGFIALPTNAAYVASKHALEAYSDTLRMEMRSWGVKVVVIQPSTFRTPLAMGYYGAWLKSFSNAPEDRKAPYGDDWAHAVAEHGQKAIEDSAADPTVTVKAMAAALTMKNPKLRYKTGTAKFLYQPLSWLPHSLRDVLLPALVFAGHVPKALASP